MGGAKSRAVPLPTGGTQMTALSQRETPRDNETPRLDFSHTSMQTHARARKDGKQMVVGGGKEVLMVERVVLLPLATRSQRLTEETA